MFQDEIDKVELPAIEQLKRSGLDLCARGSAGPAPACRRRTAGERGYYRDVVLTRRLEAAVQRLNPWISDENLRKVVREFTHPNHAGLMEYNQSIHGLLVNYLSVEQDLGTGRRGQTVKVIDFDNPANNEFLCTNQFKSKASTRTSSRTLSAS
jgi:type I restriction enzyme, R subunit